MQIFKSRVAQVLIEAGPANQPKYVNLYGFQSAPWRLSYFAAYIATLSPPEVSRIFIIGSENALVGDIAWSLAHVDNDAGAAS